MRHVPMLPCMNEPQFLIGLNLCLSLFYSVSRIRQTYSDESVISNRYRAMQVLNNKFNVAYSPIIATMGSWTIFLTQVVYAVVAIKHYHDLPMSVLPIFPIVNLAITLLMLAILKISATCNDKSLLFLCTWKWGYRDPKHDRLLSKQRLAFVTSSQALKFVIGNISYISRSSTFLYMGFVMQSTISLMVAMEFE